MNPAHCRSLADACGVDHGSKMQDEQSHDKHATRHEPRDTQAPTMGSSPRGTSWHFDPKIVSKYSGEYGVSLVSRYISMLAANNVSSQAQLTASD